MDKRVPNWPQGVEYMAGTEETGEYVVRSHSLVGRVGVRDCGNFCRIRVEPSDVATGAEVGKMLRHLARDTGWKQPNDNGQYRFSIMVEPDQVEGAVQTAEKAIGRGPIASLLSGFKRL